MSENSMQENHGLSTIGGYIAENSWLAHTLKDYATRLNSGEPFGVDRDDKEELLTAIESLIISIGAAGEREIPAP